VSTVDDRLAALGIGAARDQVTALASAIGSAGPEQRRKVLASLMDPSRPEVERRTLEPLAALVALIDSFGVSEVLAALDRAGNRQRRERARK
jgi:hypothetical protein